MKFVIIYQVGVRQGEKYSSLKKEMFQELFEFQLALEKSLKSIKRKNFKIKKTLHRSF